MCGVFGYVGVRDGISRGILTAVLANEMERRGEYSWGTVLVNRTKAHRILKGTGSINNANLREIAAYSTVLGHTRYPTVGKVTKQTAHPFSNKRFVWLHNGGVFNHSTLAGEYEVDSMYLGDVLLGKIDPATVDGYGTLVWLDMESKNGVHVCRWNSGELAVATLKRGNAVCGTVWASTERAVRLAATQAGYKPEFFRKTQEKVIHTIQNDGLYVTKRKLAFASWDTTPKAKVTLCQTESTNTTNAKGTCTPNIDKLTNLYSKQMQGCIYNVKEFATNLDNAIRPLYVCDLCKIYSYSYQPTCLDCSMPTREHTGSLDELGGYARLSRYVNLD